MPSSRLFVRFLRERCGNVLPIFALASLPLFGFVGAAVDYSRANSVKGAMQTALDGTGLTLSKDAVALSSEQLTQKANDYFGALFNRPEAHDIRVIPMLSAVTPGRYKLNLTASAIVDTTFMRVFHRSQMTVSAAAEVDWGYKKLELALALDNTGSMSSSGKIQALKTATHNLLNTLKAAARNPGDIKVAIIPFDTTVNIGTSYGGQFWIDYSVEGIKPSKWQGCVKDRDQSNDVMDTAPINGVSATYYPATGCGALVSAIPLSSDWSALHSKVDEMAAAGYTNVTIGLVWAWHSLTGSLPFTEAAAPAPDLDKVIIALTDGDNTRNRWTSSQSAIDKRTAAVCANIKASGIKIYAVRVINGNASLLRSCATNPSMYYDVQQAGDLNAVFSAIAASLANLRLSK